MLLSPPPELYTAADEVDLCLCLMNKVLTRNLRRIVFAAAMMLVAGFLGGCAHLTQKEFTFVQMCDPQLGFGDYEADLNRFEQAVEQINALRPDFVVICGDLVHDPAKKSFGDFATARAKLAMTSHCAAGNHDIGNAPTGQTLQVFRESVGKDYYSFEHRGFLFLVLNTQLWKSPLAGETERQEAWLHQTLTAAARKGRPVFVVGHYPPFVKTPEEPDAYFNLPLEKRMELLAAFERSGVVAVLAGHTHTTALNHYHQIQVVNSETTSKNFDQRPFGFRLWRVTPSGHFQHKFVPLTRQN